MKITNDLINILQSFSKINDSILFVAGKEQRTWSLPMKDLFSVATLDAPFPKDVAIYNLKQFTEALSLLNGGTVEFGDTFATIKKDKNVIEFYYADASLIQPPTKSRIEFKSKFTFHLTAAQISEIISAASILDSEVLHVVSKNGRVSIGVSSKEAKAASNSYRLDVGLSDFDFDYIISLLRFSKILSKNDYDVVVPDKPCLYLSTVANNLPVEYWIGLENASTLHP